MNPGYLIYQAERSMTAAEQRRIDEHNGMLAASVARRVRSFAAPLNFLRRAHNGQQGSRTAAPGCATLS
jgi:hypothetical protein